jgi:hypothetical protein
MKESSFLPTPTLPAPEQTLPRRVAASVAGAFDFNASHLALSLTRIGFFAIVMFELIQLYTMRQVSFVPTHQWIGNLIVPLDILFVVSIIAGFKTRLSCIVHYFLFVWMIEPTVMDGYHFDYVICIFSLLFMFSPLPKTLSIDNRLKKVDNPRQLVPTWFFIAFTLAIFQLYFDSCIWKFQSQIWLKGIVVYLAALPYRSIISFPTWLEIDWIIKAMSYFAFAFEVTFLLIFLRKVRPIFGVIGFLFHLGITLLCPVPWFGLGMASLFLFFIKWEELLAPFKLEFLARNTLWSKDRSLPILYAYPAMMLALQLSLLFAPGDFYVLQATGLRRHGLYRDANFEMDYPVLRFVAYNGDRKFEIPTYTNDCHLVFPYGTGRYYGSLGFFLRGYRPNPNIERFVNGWLVKEGFDAEFVKVYSHETKVPLELNFDSDNLISAMPWTESGKIVYRTNSKGEKVSKLKWNDWYKARYKYRPQGFIK